MIAHDTRAVATGVHAALLWQRLTTLQASLQQMAALDSDLRRLEDLAQRFDVGDQLPDF